jgi:hypothetical protein
MTSTPTLPESLPDAPASLATLRYQLEARQQRGLLELLLPARGRVLAGRFAGRRCCSRGATCRAATTC